MHDFDNVTLPPQVDVVGVGLNAADTIIRVREYPQPGTKIESQSLQFSPGGQVATAMVACQRWGLRTRYVGKLGDDPAAEVHRREFANEGVEAKLITVPSCASAQSIILVDSQGERTVILRLDERLKLEPTEIDREWIVSARALLIDGFDTAAAVTAAKWARDAGIPVIADFDEVYDGMEELLPHVDYLIVSKEFPERMCGEANLSNALAFLQRRWNCRLAAATLGVDGVLACDGQKFHHACAYRVPVADTTGAGDIFHAGFIYGLLQNWALEKQLDFACASAALNCTAVGARGGIRSVQEIEELIKAGNRHSTSISWEKD